MLARAGLTFLCIVIETQAEVAIGILVDLAAFLAKYRLGADRYLSACGNDAGVARKQSRFMTGKDPWRVAVDGPSVHGGRVIVGEFLQCSDVAGQGVADCKREGDIRGGKRDRAIECESAGFGPGKGGMSGRSPGGSQLRSAAARGGFLGEQRCPFSEGSNAGNMQGQ